MKRLRSDEAGVVYVLMVLSILIVMAMAAFAVDIGWIFLNKGRAQRASDAAALAGVTALPAEPAVAIARARDYARINGYDDGLGNVVVTPLPTADNELRVEIDDEIGTFFMKVFGIDTVPIHVSSRARYVASVPLGNPDNIFGPEPGTPGQTFADVGFWPAITFQYDGKGNGDAFATRCTRAGSSGTSCGSGPTNGEWYGIAADGDPDGYWYGIEVPSGTTNLSVEVYDAGYGQGGQPTNDQVYPTETSSLSAPSNEVQRLVIRNAQPASSTYTVTIGGDTTQPIPIPGAPNNGAFLEAELEALPGISAVTIVSAVENPAAGDFTYQYRIDSPATNFGLATCLGTLLPVDPLIIPDCHVEAVTDGGTVAFSFETTFRLYSPDDTPFDFRDNDPEPGCQIDGRNETTAGTNYAWTQLCFLANPTPGVYPLRIFAGPGLTWNEFSLRANAGSGTVRLFALEDLSIATRIRAGFTSFYLAEVAETYRGLDFVVELFDPGDLASGTNSDISIIAPDGTVFPTCTRTVARDPAGSPSYSDPLTLTPCTLDTSRPGPAGSDGYQADWVKFTIRLPGAYTCPLDSGGKPFCWWKVRYNYPGQAQERTTWKASVEGSQVALVFDDAP